MRLFFRDFDFCVRTLERGKGRGKISSCFWKCINASSWKWAVWINPTKVYFLYALIQTYRHQSNMLKSYKAIHLRYDFWSFWSNGSRGVTSFTIKEVLYLVTFQYLRAASIKMLVANCRKKRFYYHHIVVTQWCCVQL